VLFGKTGVTENPLELAKFSGTNLSKCQVNFVNGFCYEKKEEKEREI
jgi:hypothetical protein